MRFHEKVRRRVAELGINRAKAARDVGLPESTISNYMSKLESLPRADIAFKIAKALAVPVAWLLDDEQDYPPPEGNEPSLSNIDNGKLMLEIARRYRLELLDLLDAVKRAEKADLRLIREEEKTWKPGQLPPSESFKIITAATLLRMKPNPWNVAEICKLYHHALPGSDLPAETLTVEAVNERFKSIDVPKDVNAWLVRMLNESNRHAHQRLVEMLSRLPQAKTEASEE